MNTSHLEMLLQAHTLNPAVVENNHTQFVMGLALADVLLTNGDTPQGAGALTLSLGAVAASLINPSEAHTAEHFRLAETMLLECAAACRVAQEHIIKENTHGA